MERHLATAPEFPWLTLISGDESTTISIRRLAERTYDYCSFYRKLGIAENDTVVIILKESLDLFASFFAGIIYGALPAYYFYPSPKQSIELFLRSVENLLVRNKIKIIVSNQEVISVLKGHHAIEAPHFIGFVEYTDVPSGNRSTLDDVPRPGREAFLQFSSGTTGAKKGVKISTEALFNQITAYAEFANMRPGDKVVSWLPHYHDMGLIACMLMPFVNRVELYMLSPFEWVKNPRLLLDWITRVKGTHMWLPNFSLGHISRSIPDSEVGSFDLRSLKRLVCCSEPVLKETVDVFLQKFQRTGLDPAHMQNCFAMAENTFAMTSTSEGPIRFLTADPDIFRKEHRIQIVPRGRDIASAGKPITNTEVRVVSETGGTLPPDAVGEILIRSNCMLEGYHNNKEETNRTMRNGWFRTGDLGFFHEGELYITGRIKDMIIVGGENIYPQDIELILNSCEYLLPGRNVAFGVEHSRTGTERIVVLAEVRSGQHVIDTIPLRTEILNVVGVSVSQLVLLPHMCLLKGTAGKISRFLNKQAFLDGKFDGIRLKETA